MQSVTAENYLTTRPRPVSPQPVMPIREIRSTHTATCPECGTEARIKRGPLNADIFGGCSHVRQIEQ
jgi:hypothetical protein